MSGRKANGARAATVTLALLIAVAGATAAGEDSVAATLRHWIGDGGTIDGRDQGNTPISEDELIE